MKKYILVAITIFLAFTAWYYWRNPLATRIRIKGHIFTVELAITPQEKERGLGGREYLPPDRGLLFPYDHKEQYGFWMKNMNFPIDILWIDGKTIVDITPNVPVSTTEPLPIYRPKAAVDKVLEFTAGTVEKYDIQPGDTVEIVK